MVQRVQVIVGAVLLVSLGALLAERYFPTAEPDRSALTRLLNFRGPVQRVVEVETQVGSSPLLGSGRTRIVTEIARDERAARVVGVRTYQDREGKTTATHIEKRYVVSGSLGREVVRVSSRTGDYQVETTNTFEGPCLVQSSMHHTSKGGSFKEVIENRCDGRGRILEQTTRRGEKVISRATCSWFLGRWAFCRQWHAALGESPAYQNNGFMHFDAYGNSLNFRSSMADLRYQYKYDQRGNWTWHKSELTPTSLAGNNVYTRNITYWDE